MRSAADIPRSPAGYRVYTILLMGWVEGFLWNFLGPSRGIIAYLVLPELALVFLIAALALLLPAPWQYRAWMTYASPIWALAATALGILMKSAGVWDVLQLSAAVPLIYVWLRNLSTIKGGRLRNMVLAWAGAAVVSGTLAVLNHLFPTSSRLTYMAALIPLEYLAVQQSAIPYSHRPRNEPIQRTPGFLVSFATVGFSIGAEVHPESQSLGALGAPPLLFGLASMAVLFLMVLLKPGRFSLLAAQLSGMLLAADLLAQFDPAIQRFTAPLEVVLFAATYLLLLSWIASFPTEHRNAPYRFGISCARAATAVAIGWSIHLLAALHPYSATLSLLAIVIIVFIAPAVAMESVNLSQIPSISQIPDDVHHASNLTPQERRIVDLLLQGRNNQEIIQELYISINTLKTHLKNIYRKTETKNRRELIERMALPGAQNASDWANIETAGKVVPNR